MKWKEYCSVKKKLVLDTNIWIKTLLQIEPYKRLLQELKNKNSNFQVIIDSYGAAEAMHSVRNLAKSIHAASTMYERAFWSVLDKIDCMMDFELPISKNLLEIAKNKTEYIMLAKTYDVETKDIPFIVLAYKSKAQFLTSDTRSLVEKRDKIYEILKVEILTVEEFYTNI